MRGGKSSHFGQNGEGTFCTPDFIKLKDASGSEDVHYSVFYEGIPEKFLLEAKEKLNETEENKCNGMNSLGDFAKRNDLRCTDDDLLFVLRICKYDIKKAKKKLSNYLKLRQKILTLVSNMDDSKTEMILDDMIFGVLPYRDKYGRITLISRPNVHFNLYDPDDIDPLALAFVLYVCTLPLTTVTGINYIPECKTDNLYTLYPIIKQFRKSYLNLAMDLPIRVGRIDVVNENFLVRWAYNIMRPLVPEKITKRLNFHGNDYETLKAYYKPEMLPEDFGGNIGPLSDKHFRQRLLNFIQHLKEENEMIRDK